MTTCDNITNLSSIQVTRIKLLGAGIVCGLEVFRDTQCYISLTYGVGVTSTGEVICISDKTLKYYKEYGDPNKYFHSLINCKNDKGTKICGLWELIEHREEGAVSIVPQNAASVDKPFLEDKVVLLYLEDEAKMIVRILLIEQADMWEILKCGCILKTHCIPTEPKEEGDISIFDKNDPASLPGDEDLYNAVHKKYMLNEIAVRRFGYGQVDISDLILSDDEEKNLNPNFDFTDTAPGNSAKKFFKEYEVIIDETLEKLDSEIDKLHGYFGCMIDACHCKEKETGAEENSPCNPVTPGSQAETGLQMHNIKIFKNYFTLINKKWAIYKKNGEPAESIQYFYDFIKDLVKTYNELLHELYELMNECCADTECFPHHLMLGRINEEVSFQPSIFRQPYLQPPVYNDNANRLQKIRFLHWRMVIMMKCFYIPDWELDDMSDESYYDVLQMENEKQLGQDPRLPVRITPGRLFNEVLGKQAIPFYYNLSDSPYSLQYYWDYFSTKHNREDHQLSYFCKEDPGYSDLNFVVHPFLYSLDQYPFYRIEGHTGMPVDQAVAQIKRLRKKYGLSFDIRAITFNDLKTIFLQPFDDMEIAAYGIDHAGGVQKGYTFLLLHDSADNKPGKVIADFQLPFMFSTDLKGIIAPLLLQTPPAPGDEDKELKEKAAKDWKTRLEKINTQVKRTTNLLKTGIIPGETVKALSNIQIEFAEQLAQLTPDDIVLINLLTGKPIPNLEESIKIANEFLKKNLMEKIGAAPGKDDLKKIKGISDKLEATLNKAGIKSYQQLAILTDDDIPVLAKAMEVLPYVIKGEWFKQAKSLLQNS